MFVKLQCIDTNSLYLLSSINSSSKAFLSPSPDKFEPINKQTEPNSNFFTLKHKKPIFYEPKSSKISFSPYPDEKSTISSHGDEFERDLGLKSGRRVVPAKCSTKCVKRDPKNISATDTIEYGHNLELKLTLVDASRVAEETCTKRSTKCVNRVEKSKGPRTTIECKSSPTRCRVHTGIWMKRKSNSKGSTRTLYKKAPFVKLANVNGHSVVDGKKRSCSKKCMHYGGRIPEILESLETYVNLDEALRPWEGSLRNKEMSIILKGQSSWERALDIFEWFKRQSCCEVNVIHYNIMLRILGKARRWDLIESLWDEMKKRNIMPVNSTYGTLIDIYSKGALLKEALRWLELMKEHDMEPDEVTMGIVIQMYKKAKEFEKAEQFFKKWTLDRKTSLYGDISTARRAPARMNGDLGFIHLSSYTYNTLIDTFGKAGQLKEASETFEKMLQEGISPTTVTFNTLIHMLGNHDRLGEVKLLIGKMEELHCQPDTRTYNILIYIYVKLDDIEMADKYFTKMKERSLEPDLVSYRTLLRAFSIRQMVTRAENLVSEMDEKGLQIDEFTQSALTRMYIETGMIEKSWAWFARFHLEGKMSSESYSANIDAFGVHGHVLEAEKVFISCKEGRKPSVLEFNVMIKAYGLSKRYDKACELFDSMNKYNLVPDKCSYSSLIQILAGADLPHLAVIYIRKMQKAGLIDDCIAHCSVISSFVRLGELEKAEKIFTEMVGYNVRPDVVAYGVLINAFADNGSVKKALNYIKSMEEACIPMNMVICNSLIKLYTKVGYLTEAEKIYNKLQSFEEGPSAYSLNCMLNLYGRQSMVKQAEDIFDNLTRKGEANEFSYAMILCMYKRLGRYQEAIRIARKMRELGLLTVLLSYNQVLDVYALAGRFKEAFRTFEEMIQHSVQPDDSTFKSLRSILVKCGLSKGAVNELEKTRRKDPERGLRTWFSTLTCVICVGNDEHSNEG